MKVALSRRHKHRRFGQLPSHLCSPPLAKSASSVGATSAVINMTVPMIRRTTVQVYAATPSTARMRLSGHRDASAVGRALQHLQPQGQPLSSRHVRTVATRRKKLGDHPGARGASTALPIYHHRDSLVWKGIPRRTEPLPQRLRNSPLEIRSSSVLQWTGRHPLSWCSSPGISAQSTQRPRNGPLETRS